MIKVRDLETGLVLVWDIAQVLHEINRDRSDSWSDYDETDWFEGWSNWVEGHTHEILEIHPLIAT